MADIIYVPVVVVMPATDAERLAAHTAATWPNMPADTRDSWDDVAFAHGWTREAIVGGQMLANTLRLVTP